LKKIGINKVFVQKRNPTVKLLKKVIDNS